MGPFMSSNGMKYILVEVDYVLKWVKLLFFKRIKVEVSPNF